MMHQVLSPGVKHAEETDLGTEMFRIGGDLQESCRAGSKQKSYRAASYCAGPEEPTCGES